jgi:protein TonB
MATVYLADRDISYRKELARTLRQRGIQTEEFTGGFELYARAIEKEPDLILLETDLEDVDGFQVFMWLQRKRPEKPYPVAFLTRFEHPGVANVCKQRGALDYLGKGRLQGRVAERVQGLLGDRDPLHGRSLAAALAWLQSRGRSGRLEVTACGEAGHVLLSDGKVLESCWNSLEGEAALTMFREVLLGARFRFIEGLDETGLPPAGDLRGAPGPDLPEPVSEPSFDAGPASSITTLPADARPDVEPPVAGRPAEGGPGAPPREPTGKDATDGVVRIPRLPRGDGPDESRVESERERHAALLVLQRVAAITALVLTAGLAMVALFPDRLPKGPSSLLNSLATPPSGSETQKAAPAPVPEPSAAAGSSVLARDPEARTGTLEKAAPVGLAPASLPKPAERRAPGQQRDAPPSRIPTRETRPLSAAPVAPVPAPQEAETSPPEAFELNPPREQEEAAETEPALLLQSTEPAAPEPTTPASPLPADRSAAARQPSQPLASATNRPSLVGEGRAPAQGPAPDAEPPSSTGRPSGAGSVTGGGGTAADSRPTLELPLRVRYPPALANLRVSGAVSLRVLVGASGRVEDVELLRSSGHQELDGAAMDAVRGASYRPAREDGVAVPAWIQQRVMGLCCRTTAAPERESAE